MSLVKRDRGRLSKLRFEIEECLRRTVGYAGNFRYEVNAKCNAPNGKRKIGQFSSNLEPDANAD